MNTEKRKLWIGAIVFTLILLFAMIGESLIDWLLNLLKI